MSRFNSRRLLAIPIIALMGWGGQADARPARVDQLPNGKKFGCASCHVDQSGGGALTPFGDVINRSYLTQSGSRGRVEWNAALAMLDSDGDGVSNGRELGDPDGDGILDPSIEVTNPGDPASSTQRTGDLNPDQGIDGPPTVLSVVIGGVTLEEDANNPPVPSGMQSLEVAFDKPLRVIMDSDGDLEIEVPVGIYPLPENPAAWGISADSLKLTASIQLPENATYQLIVDPPAQQQYFFGTVALPDAVVSGMATVPEGVTLTDEPGSAVLLDTDAYSKAYQNLLSMDDDSTDLFQFLDAILDSFLPTVIRIDAFDTLESLPSQLAFELKHVPDGTYILALNQNAVDAKGDTIELSASVGINALTGAPNPDASIRVENGEGPTNLQIALRTEVEDISILKVRVDRIDGEKNQFFVQRDGRQVAVSVTVAKSGGAADETWLVAIADASLTDPFYILSQLEAGMLTGIRIFPFNELMAGDTISVFGWSSSDDAIKAQIVVRHESPVVIGDLTGDGMVNFSDFLLFAAAFGKSVGDEGYNPKADLNNDDAVNFADFLIFAQNFGN